MAAPRCTVWHRWSLGLDQLGQVLAITAYHLSDPVVQKFSKDGTPLAAFGTLGTGDKDFIAPHTLIVDPGTGNVLISDGMQSRIMFLSSRGTYLGQLGPPDGPLQGSCSRLNGPTSMAISRGGTSLYVVNSGAGLIQVFRFKGGK
jgi:DNA-binding beta-propeller fold protein YncE